MVQKLFFLHADTTVQEKVKKYSVENSLPSETNKFREETEIATKTHFYLISQIFFLTRFSEVSGGRKNLIGLLNL